tara:strand:+ start:345 stop:797 length:453 start_codon:yes stop_codon:yes gene_type:complete
MKEAKSLTTHKSYGSEELDKIVGRLKTTEDPRKRYEYVLWLAKKLPLMPDELKNDANKVQGCISEVFVLGHLINGKINWRGDSDALITKGLLALIIQGLNNLTPQEVLDIDPSFIAATGLNASLTPSRANGFLNILLSMKTQAQKLTMGK